MVRWTRAEKLPHFSPSLVSPRCTTKEFCWSSLNTRSIKDASYYLLEHEGDEEWELIISMAFFFWSFHAPAYQKEIKCFCCLLYTFRKRCPKSLFTAQPSTQGWYSFQWNELPKVSRIQKMQLFYQWNIVGL